MQRPRRRPRKTRARRASRLKIYLWLRVVIPRLKFKSFEHANNNTRLLLHQGPTEIVCHLGK